MVISTARRFVWTARSGWLPADPVTDRQGGLLTGYGASMDLQKLEYFLAVRSHGSVNAAAARLGVAQPTISQALRALEREFGIELFHRIGRGMVLTSAGHALAGPARRLMRDVASTTSSVSGHEGNLSGVIEIAAAPSLAMGPVVELIAEFHRRLPRTRVHIEWLRDETKGLEMLRDGDVELVLTHLPVAVAPGPLWDRDFDVLQMGVQEYWYAVPPSEAHRLPDGDGPIDFADLPEIPMVIVPGSAVAGQIEAAVTDVGRALRPAAVLEHREARMSFVAAGVGSTFLERSLIESAVARGIVCRQVDPAIRRPFGFVYDEEEISPVGAAFIDCAAGVG